MAKKKERKKTKINKAKKPSTTAQRAKKSHVIRQNQNVDSTSITDGNMKDSFRAAFLRRPV